jgi:hypothetical protein
VTARIRAPGRDEGAGVDGNPLAGLPIPRIGPLEELARLALFLASDESS